MKPVTLLLVIILAFQVENIEMFPREGRGAARVTFRDFDQNATDMGSRSAIRMAGAAGEQRAGFNTDLERTASNDIKQVKQDAQRIGADPNFETNQGLNAARRLLEGELAGQHMELTRFLVQNYGKALSFSDFKHILQPLHVSPKHYATLYKNYTMQSQDENA